MRTTEITSSDDITAALQDEIEALPAGEFGDLQLIFRTMAEAMVQTARIRAIMNGMKARGMFDNIYVDLTQGEPQFSHHSSLAAMPTLPTPTVEPPKRFLTSEEAAKYLGLNVKNPSCTMSRMVRKRVLPKRMKLNKLFFLREELDDYMAKGSWTGRGRPRGASNKRKDVVLIPGK